jgi:hypothetical protein
VLRSIQVTKPARGPGLRPARLQTRGPSSKPTREHSPARCYFVTVIPGYLPNGLARRIRSSGQSIQAINLGILPVTRFLWIARSRSIQSRQTNRAIKQALQRL